MSAKNRPGFLSQKPGRSYTLLVLSQALTQLLAGVLDRSLRGCQNYRALGIILLPPGAAQRFLLNRAASACDVFLLLLWEQEAASLSLATLTARKATMKRHNMNIRRGFSYCFFLRRRIHPLSHWFPDLPCADSCGFPPESPPVAHRTILPHTRRSS